jgi:hypothetical protein
MFVSRQFVSSTVGTWAQNGETGDFAPQNDANKIDAGDDRNRTSMRLGTVCRWRGCGVEF